MSSSHSTGPIIFPIASLCIAQIKCIKVLYMISKPFGDTAYLFIENPNDPKTVYPIFKRSTDADGKEYFSLVSETMHNGFNWKPYLYWRFHYNIKNFEYSHQNVSLNGRLCHKICYKSNNITMFPFKKQNSQDLKLMWNTFQIHSFKHNSIEFVEANINAFYLKEYIPLEVGLQNPDEIEYYTQKVNDDKYDILHNKHHKISQLNEINWIEAFSQPHIYDYIEV